MSEPVETRHFFPKLQRNETSTSSGSTVVSYTTDLGPDTPIMTLIHGYPQSAYEWRYIVPAFLDKVSLFVPELPGYGISSPSTDNTRLGITGALIEALSKVFNATQESPRKVIAVGHDRGARIVHRLTVSRIAFPAVAIIGVGIFDIVPTKAQWDAFTNPLICAGYFHWPLLANVDYGMQLIKKYGGGQWVRDMHQRITGGKEDLARASADGALDVYAACFEKDETLKYSGEDYAYGAAPEYQHQADDQKAGRKIDVPALVMFSKAKLGARIDVAGVWKDWVAPGTELQAIGVGDGHGHFLPEEAPREVTDALNVFIAKLT